MSLGVFSIKDRVDDAVLMASVQGAFFGANLPAARIEGLIAAHVPKVNLREVAEGYGTKWWDYRRLSPGHSFLLFAHHYYKAFRVAAKRFNAERARERASGARGLGSALIGVAAVQYKVEEIWDRDQGHITGMWKAMLTADALGMPYDQFCILGFEAAVETMWRRLPSPAQLYSPKLGGATIVRWEEKVAGRLFTAHHPLFSLANYGGAVVQDGYREWLVGQIKLRGDPTAALATAVYRVPQLPEQIARQHFSATAIDRARLLAT